VTAVPEVLLNNGERIPQLGFGVFQVKPAETAAAVTAALEAGYRHVDTAQMYRNEAGVGQAVAQSGLDRAEVFLTTKLHNDAHRPDDARRAFDQSLAALGTDYVDLFLIHWPLPGRYEGDFWSTWHALEELYREGRARSIGVSNFQVSHLQRLMAEAQVPPAVNQVEVSPFLTQAELRQFCHQDEIAVQAYSPLARGRALGDPAVVAIARRLGATPAQVIVRWHVERGDIPLPKSVNPHRIKENIVALALELSPEDVAAITALNRDERTGFDPDEFDGRPPRR
jgi:2,5-diketo-D-gluconate reductase A